MLELAFVKRSALLLILLFLPACAHTPYQKDVVFQNAPIQALLAGCYSGTMSIHDLGKHGDFGFGTVDALDGEMVALDHAFYQIKPDGKVRRLKDQDTIPYATVTFFGSGQVLAPEQAMTYTELTGFLDKNLSSENLIYAIKVEGRFSWLKVRSAARQNKPYPVLTEAIKEQKIFELKDQEGTLVGFRFPSYAEGVNVPGYHFHFINKDTANCDREDSRNFFYRRRKRFSSDIILSVIHVHSAVMERRGSFRRLRTHFREVVRVIRGL